MENSSFLCKSEIEINEQQEEELGPTQSFGSAHLFPCICQGTLFQLHLSVSTVQLYTKHFCLDVLNHSGLPFTTLYFPVLLHTSTLFFSSVFPISVKYTIVKFTRNLDKSQAPFSSVSVSLNLINRQVTANLYL